jgi:hypothetical protein
MFPILAIVCFLLVFLKAPVDWDLTNLGLAFLGAWCLVGNWPIGARLTR